MTSTAKDTVCRFLGVPGDPATRFVMTTPAHRCHARKRIAPIAADHQAAFCLTPAHPTCPRFPKPNVSPAAAVPDGVEQPAGASNPIPRRTRGAAVADGLVLAILLLVVGAVIAALAMRAMP